MKLKESVTSTGSDSFNTETMDVEGNFPNSINYYEFT